MSLVIAQAPPLREGLIQSAVVVAVLAVVWVIVSRIGHRLIDRLVERASTEGGVRGDDRAQRIRTLWLVGRMFVLILLGVALALLLLDVWGVPIGPFLAVGSVVGVAIGFGAQDLVRDIIAGLFIIGEDQYGIDDIVRIGGVSGKVESIRLRTTVLRDLDGNVHHVPNGQVTVASNLTQVFSQVVVDLGVSYETNVDHGIEVIADEASRFAADPEWEEAFLDPPEMLGVDRFDDSAIVIRVVFKVHPAYRWSARREFLRRVKNRFDAEGISIPYPHLEFIDRTPRPQDEAPEGHREQA
jgi:small conductance mechanosensitive channel